jgi:hypothetical protein
VPNVNEWNKKKMDIGKHGSGQIEWQSSSDRKNPCKASHKEQSHTMKETTKEINYNEVKKIMAVNDLEKIIIFTHCQRGVRRICTI